MWVEAQQRPAPRPGPGPGPARWRRRRRRTSHRLGTFAGCSVVFTTLTFSLPLAPEPGLSRACGPRVTMDLRVESCAYLLVATAQVRPEHVARPATAACARTAPIAAAAAAAAAAPACKTFSRPPFAPPAARHLGALTSAGWRLRALGAGDPHCYAPRGCRGCVGCARELEEAPPVVHPPLAHPGAPAAQQPQQQGGQRPPAWVLHRLRRPSVRRGYGRARSARQPPLPDQPAAAIGPAARRPRWRGC